MTQPLTSYLDLCTQFYDLSKPVPPEDSYLFYRSFAEDADGPILEPMCGTGRFLLPLVQDGYDVSGFDASDHMLSVLNTKAADLDLHPKVWKGFVEDQTGQGLYNLIYIPSGSFGLLAKEKVSTSALKTFYKLLAPGGTLLFEAEAPHTAKVGHSQELKVVRPDGKTIRMSYIGTLKGQISTYNYHYDLLEGSRILLTEFETLQIRTYERGELTEKLKKVGFSYVKTHRAYERNRPPRARDDVIVYEARKVK